MTPLAAYRIFHWIAQLPADPFAGCGAGVDCGCERRCAVHDAALRGESPVLVGSSA